MRTYIRVRIYQRKKRQETETVSRLILERRDMRQARTERQILLFRDVVNSYQSRINARCRCRHEKERTKFPLYLRQVVTYFFLGSNDTALLDFTFSLSLSLFVFLFLFIYPFSSLILLSSMRPFYDSYNNMAERELVMNYLA